MRKKRINSTLQLRISVLTGGESRSLEGRNIKVFLVDPRGNQFEPDFRVENNVITYVYEGKVQEFTGVYRTEIYENYMEDNMASLDVDCFELVPRTKMENDDIDDLAIETIDISVGTNSTQIATTAFVKTAISVKQDTISDLETIRSGASAGATAYQKPNGGIPKSDLSNEVQTSLGKADTALQSFTETDPTVPSWAKQSSKPTYTAQEVGALPASTSIPSKTSDLTNDSGFLTTLPFTLDIGTHTYNNH